MKKISNEKIISILLISIIILTYIKFPDNAYGATINFTGTTSSALQTAINNATSGDTIVITKDVTITNDEIINIPSGKTITITDNNNTVKLWKYIRDQDETTGLFKINTGATLNIRGTGYNTLILDGGGSHWANYDLIRIDSGGTLNMYDGAILTNSKNTQYSSYGVRVMGVFNMYGGIITDITTSGGGAVYLNGGTFNMYGGVIKDNTNVEGSGTYAGGAGVWMNMFDTVFNMYGGKIINNFSYYQGKEGYYSLRVGNKLSYFSHYGGIIADTYILTTDIVLSGPSSVDVGSTISLSANISPSNVSDKSLLWYSSDPNIASVDLNGVITGHASGTVIITAVANDGSGVKATKEITVKSSITNITLNGETSLVKGDIINITAIITPNNVTNKTLIWTSSNTNVATIVGTGLVGTVRGISEGTTNITATATDGSGKSSTLTITVTDSSPSVETNTILLGQKIKYITAFSDEENDPLYSNYYYYSHNPNYYDNSLGQIESNNVWLDKPIVSFNKTGYYLVKFKVKDNPPTSNNNENFANYRKDSLVVEKNMFVHRKPVAIFTLSGTTVADKSYDLDHQNSSNKGIVNWEWNYINGDGITLNLTTNVKSNGELKVKEWLVNHGTVNVKLYLRVQDVEGVWSDWSDDLPVADFELSNPIILNKDAQVIVDTSYDSKGLALTEYYWTVKKGSTTLFTSYLKDISSTINNYITNNGAGNYTVSLRVKNSNNQYSNVRTQGFDVIEIPENLPPVVNLSLSSRDNWTFPKILGTNTLKREISNITMFFYEEPIRFNVSVNEPENQNLKYEWEIENLSNPGAGIKKYSGISNKSNPYVPFSNSFKNALGTGGGYYRINLKVTDIPVSPYDTNDSKYSSVTNYYYIVPELSITGSFESSNTEIMVGDTIKLKAKASKETESVYCTFVGINYELIKVSEDSNFAYWEKNIIVPDSIIESGTYSLSFIGSTTYGGNGSVTREMRDTVSLDIVTLKLINFRITDIINHTHISFPYTKEMLQTKLISYKAGYYVTFKIDSKGKPDNVYGRVDVGNNGSIDQVIDLTKATTGDTETWQGRFYTSSYLPAGTIISIKLDCLKNSTIYDYNEKENWDGRSLITEGSAMMDGRVNLTN